WAGAGAAAPAAERAGARGATPPTGADTRRRFAVEGLEAALTERPRNGAPPRLDGKQEALIVALACSPAPDGEARWSIRRLTERVVALEVAETVARETVRRLLKRAPSSRGRNARGACRRG